MRKPRIEKIRDDGIQRIYKFKNGFGASVIRNLYSYGHEKGLWELAVIKFEKGTENWSLVYDTPITQDVMGYLTGKEVDDILAKIEKLK